MKLRAPKCMRTLHHRQSFVFWHFDASALSLCTPHVACRMPNVNINNNKTTVIRNARLQHHFSIFSFFPRPTENIHSLSRSLCYCRKSIVSIGLWSNVHSPAHLEPSSFILEDGTRTFAGQIMSNDCNKIHLQDSSLTFIFAAYFVFVAEAANYGTVR